MGLRAISWGVIRQLPRHQHGSRTAGAWTELHESSSGCVTSIRRSPVFAIVGWRRAQTRSPLAGVILRSLIPRCGSWRTAFLHIAQYLAISDLRPDRDALLSLDLHAARSIRARRDARRALSGLEGGGAGVAGAKLLWLNC